MLNPKARSFDYQTIIQKQYYPSSLFSCPSYTLPSFSAYSYPFIQTQQPAIYNNYLIYYRPVLSQHTLITHSPAVISGSDFLKIGSHDNTSSCKVFELSLDLPTKEEEIPTKEIEQKTGRTVAVAYKRFRGRLPALSRCFGKKSVIWRRKVQTKESGQKEITATNAETDPFQFTSSESDLRTTVMIKNIPNRYRSLSSYFMHPHGLRNMLLELLDQHCVEENKKALLGSDPLLSEYDFVYLPIDFKNKCNLGYAFVNFTSATAAARLFQAMHKFKWDVFDSKKICEISYARIQANSLEAPHFQNQTVHLVHCEPKQREMKSLSVLTVMQGKAALLEHFENSCFRCVSDEFLPIQLTPPRNGSISCSPPVVVGKRKVPC